MKRLLTMSLLAVLSVPAGAEPEEQHDDHGARGETHQNSAGIFTGFTNHARRDNAFTLGAEYHRMVSGSVAIGATAEHAFGDHSFWILAAPVAYHIGQWEAVLAPGIELDDSSAHGLVRLGLLYAIEAGRIEIAPNFNLDFVSGDVVPVFGVVFAVGF
jgi:hypothetical protein